MQTMENTEKASKKECFDLQVSAALRFREGFVESGFKVAAVLSVFLGWVLTAPAAQRFLSGSPRILWLSCFGLGVVGTLTIIISFVQARRQADNVYANLCSLHYMEKRYLSHYKLSPRLFWCVILLDASLCFALLLAFLVVRRNALTG